MCCCRFILWSSPIWHGSIVMTYFAADRRSIYISKKLYFSSFTVCVSFLVGLFLLSVIFPAVFVSFCHSHTYFSPNASPLSFCRYSKRCNVLGRTAFIWYIWWNFMEIVSLHQVDVSLVALLSNKMHMHHIDATCHSKQMNQQTSEVKTVAARRSGKIMKKKERRKQINNC